MISHNACLLHLGRVFGCGRNRDGALGLGHTKITVVPHPIEKLDNTVVDNIVAGVAMSVFTDKQGHAFWCGQGIRGLEEVQIYSNYQCKLYNFTANGYNTNQVKLSGKNKGSQYWR